MFVDEVIVGGDEADQFSIGFAVVGDGNGFIAIFSANLINGFDGIVWFSTHGIFDEAVFKTFDQIHFLGLLVRGQVFVDDANPSVKRHFDGQFVFGDCVHGGTDQWDVELNSLGELGGGVDVFGEDF